MEALLQHRVRVCMCVMAVGAVCRSTPLMAVSGLTVGAGMWRAPVAVDGIVLLKNPDGMCSEGG